LILKLLSHEHTGSIVAAATTSLPEEIGGTRNWDYRYTWIRDASFTVQALYNLGHMGEAGRFLEWLNQIYARYNNPSLIKIMYSFHGEEIIDEKELSHLEGYCGSSPIRLDNKASGQQQLDIYGELLEAAFQLSRYQGKLNERL
jgi:GH15 family glucan-1,4-alpha-glucosidase